KSRRHEYVCLEHLLYALLQDKDASSAIINCGGKIDPPRERFGGVFLNPLGTLSRGAGHQTPQAPHLPRAPPPAVIHAQSAEKKEINGGNLLIAMFREPDSYAVFLLQEQGITRFDLVNYISHGISKIAATEEWSQSEDEQGEEEKPGRRVKPLESF